MWAKSLGRNKAYLSLFFAISNVLNNISLWQKNTFFEGKLCQGHEIRARKLTTFVNCSNLASPILIVEGSVYTRNILNFIPAEGIDQIKLANTYRGLKHTGGSMRWMQPTSKRTFCRCTDLRAVLLKMILSYNNNIIIIIRLYFKRVAQLVQN